MPLQTPLQTEYLGGGKYRLLQDLVFQIGDDTYVVPAGFETDFDSVPRLPIVYWIFNERAKEEAVLHDFLYHIKYDRRKADIVFNQAMKEKRLNPLLRLPIFWAVRLFGWRAQT